VGRVRATRPDALVSLIDRLPTLCDLTGVPAPNDVDGLSPRPVLEQLAPHVRDMVFAEYYGKQAWRVPIRMARLAADPGERCNLAREPGAASDRTRLARELDAWIRRIGDPFPRLARRIGQER
jgi:arylsulfatase A-like enzyme